MINNINEMKKYLKNWDLMRVLRLILGVIIVVQSIYTKEWLFIMLGIAFVLLPIFNVGCCGASSCSVPTKTSNEK